MSDMRPTDRVIIVGKTESGKTFFARYALKKVPALIVCDAKGLINSEEWNLTTWDKGHGLLMRGKDVRCRIPPPASDDEWEFYFWEILRIPKRRKYKPFVVYIDELYSVGPANGSPGLRKLYTQGRELGISVWASTQRPKRIPVFAISEAENRIIFQTLIPSDLEYLADLTPQLDDLTYNEDGTPRPLRDHNFVAYNVRSDRAVRYERLQVTKGVHR